MLAIRLQRTGRKGSAQFRVVVQDSHRSPKSGKVVYFLGSYNPHTKTVQIDKEKSQFYLTHGAQPSERVAYLLKAEGVKLPKWVEQPTKKKRTIKNPDKLRKNRPSEPKQKEEAPVEAEAAEAPVAETEETPVTAEAETPTADEPQAATAEESAEPTLPAEAAAEQPEETAS